MAYTNAIFHLDMVNGSDAARSALTGCVASNPAGSTTRINKAGHGLVTGAVVDLTLFTSWLNSAWKITVVDADNFDLDAATWQATGDPNGTVTPRGGSSWADAWRFPVTGPTAARTQGGDTIRIAKTADPVSMGQDATFTDGSQNVVLTSEVTKNIEDAISGWTVSADVTGTNNANRKLGATSQNFAFAAGFTTGKVAYKAIAGGGAQDFSSYQKITFWFFSSAVAADSAYSLCLCSDTVGDVVVDTLNLPAYTPGSSWHPIVIDKGSALGASIQSVALYANTDPGTANVRLNNIVACGDLTLQSIIGKADDVNYALQSINGTTLKIDSNNTSATGRGYSGTTETVPLYRRETFKTTIQSSILWTLPGSGSGLLGYLEYSGGWNTGSDLQDGVTYLDGTAHTGICIHMGSVAFVKISKLSFVRYSNPVAANGGRILILQDLTVISCSTPFALNQLYKFIGSNIRGLNCSSNSATQVGSNGKLINCEFSNGASSGFTACGGTEFIECLFQNNGAADITIVEGGKYGTAAVLFRKCRLLSTTEFSFQGDRDSYVWSFDHDNTPGNNKGATEGGTIEWQTGTVHGSEPGAWKLVCTSTTRSTHFPLTLKIGEAQVDENALVTLKAWVKKDHATNVAAKLYVNAQLSGMSITSATKADDTSWEELTITFTPTQKGVVELFVDVWCTATSNANVYVGTINFSQA